MKEVLKITAAVTAAVLLAMMSCSDTTAPGDDGTGGGDPGVDVPYELLAFDLTRFSTSLRGIGRTHATSVLVGEGGLAFTNSSYGTHVLPTGLTNDLNDAWSMGELYPDTLFIVGDGEGAGPGVILRYFNRTKLRMLMNHPIEGDVTSIHGTAWDNVYATGSDGRVIKWDGTSWSLIFEEPEGDALNGVWASDDGHVWVVGLDASYHHFTGSVWEERGFHSGDPGQGISGLAQDTVFSAIGNEVVRHAFLLGLVRYTDPHNRQFLSVAAQDEDWIVAVGEDGSAARQAGGGWGAVDIPTSKDLRGVIRGHFYDTALAVGDSGAFYFLYEDEWTVKMDSDLEGWTDIHGRYPNIWYGMLGGDLWRYSGSHWREVSSLDDVDLRLVYCFDEDSLMAIGTWLGMDQMLYSWDGTDWQFGAQLSSMNVPTDMWFESPTRGCIVADYATVWYKDGGASWNMTQVLNPYQHLHGVWGDGMNNLFVVGDNGAIVHGTHGGVTWTEMTSNTTEHLYDVWGWDDNHLVAVGANGTVMSYNGTWSKLETGATEDLYSVWAADQNVIWAAGEGDVVLRYNGSSWQRYNTGLRDVPVRSVWGNGDESVMFAGDDDFVLRYSR